MANTQTVMVTGEVLRVENRSGVSARTQQPYDINTVRVLVERKGIAEVTLPRDIGVPREGEDVGYLCDVSVFNGEAQLRATAELALAAA
jgi:hypothetical protein